MSTLSLIEHVMTFQQLARNTLTLALITLSAANNVEASDPAIHADAKIGFTAQDLVTLQRVSDPRISPDGASLIYALRETDMQANKGVNGLWLSNIDGSSARRLSAKGQSVSGGRFAVDGKSVYFLSSRTGTSQIWRLNLGGGEATQVSDIALDIGGFVLAPDGKTVAFSTDVFSECGSDFDCTKKRFDDTAAKKTTGTLHDKLFIRHWDTWANGTRAQLFASEFTETGMSVARLITRTADGKPMDADVPSKPHGDDSEFTFSPDSRTLYFGARIAGKTEPWSTNFDVYQSAVSGNSAAVNLTPENLAWDAFPTPSFDGKKLYYRAMTRASFEADRFRMMERTLNTGATREIAPNWDRSPDGLILSNDGKTIYTTADNLGQHPVFAINIATGKIQEISGAGTVSGIAVDKNRVVFVRDDLTAPADLFSTGLTGGPVRQISAVNAQKLAKIDFGTPEQFTFSGANGETVYGWLVKPAGFNASKKYPIAFLIHGGPQGSFGNHFHYRWNPQTYAGQGFAAVMVDFHGSTGYGQKFTDAISGDWGGKPLVDLQKGLAAARAKYTFLDADRACALGGSYGGYMTNWIAGAWSDGFKCLVTHAGIFDKRFMAYSTEELWFDEWENGGVAWDHSADIEKDNPITRVQNWKTPMLVIHGMNDFRVPFEQGVSAFTAAQRKGVVSKFLWYPDENHWILKPENSLQWHAAVNEWLHLHLDAMPAK
jgi:dipeptidyl aminopeptidase/acylaminoacyl peptidase